MQSCCCEFFLPVLVVLHVTGTLKSVVFLSNLEMQIIVASRFEEDYLDEQCLLIALTAVPFFGFASRQK